MWNGRVLLLRRGEIGDGVLSGAYSEVDFASFILSLGAQAAGLLSEPAEGADVDGAVVVDSDVFGSSPVEPEPVVSRM